MLHYSSGNSRFNKLLLDCVFVVVLIVVVFFEVLDQCLKKLGKH